MNRGGEAGTSGAKHGIELNMTTKLRDFLAGAASSSALDQVPTSSHGPYSCPMHAEMLEREHLAFSSLSRKLKQ